MRKDQSYKRLKVEAEKCLVQSERFSSEKDDEDDIWYVNSGVRFILSIFPTFCAYFVCFFFVLDNGSLCFVCLTRVLLCAFLVEISSV